MMRAWDWIEQALRDLDKARLDLENGYHEWACFTSQQAAEKAVKALSLSLNLSAWGHSITAMLRTIRESFPVPEEILRKAQRLDAFYIPTRYPNGFDAGKPADYYNSDMAEEAIDAAGAVIRFCEDGISRRGCPDRET